MAKLLLDWLNNQLVLSRPVVNIDEDFRDGFLIGEVLHKHNQIEDFSLFINKNSSAARINNFTLLEPVMRAIGVQFNSKTAFEMINAKPGVTKTLLYELKITLDRIIKQGQQIQYHSNSGATQPTTTNAETNNNSIAKITDQSQQQTKILRVIQSTKPTFDKTMSIAFENSMRAIMENPNDVLMAKTVERFTRHNQEFQSTVMVGYNLSLTAVSDEIQRKKEIHRHRKQHEKDFKEAYEQINLNQWKENQLIAKQRKELKAKVHTQQLQRKITKHTQYVNDTRSHTIGAIDEFNKRLESNLVSAEDPETAKELKSKLIKTVVGRESIGMPTLSYIDKEYLEEGLRNAQKIMTEHSEDAALRSQSHDQRRRKFVRERDATQVDFLYKYAETEIVDRLLLWSQAEHRELDMQTRILAHQHVIVRNRLHRDNLIEQLSAQEESKKQYFASTEEVFRELQWQIASQTESQLARRETLLQSEQCANRQESENICSEVVSKLLDVVDWAVACRSYGLFNEDNDITEGTVTSNSEGSRSNSPVRTGSDSSRSSSRANNILPKDIWSDCVAMFVLDLPISLPIPSPSEGRIWHDLPHCYSYRPNLVEIGANLSESFQSGSVLTTTDRAQFAQLMNSARNNANENTDISIVSAVPSVEENELGESPSKGPQSPSNTLLNASGDLLDMTGTEALFVVPSVKSEISEAIAAIDHSQFVAAVGNAVIDTSSNGGLDYGAIISPTAIAAAAVAEHSTVAPGKNDHGKPAAAAAAAAPIEDKPAAAAAAATAYHTPDWLTHTAPRHLLGDSIVSMRCAATPIPDLENFSLPSNNSSGSASSALSVLTSSRVLNDRDLYNTVVSSHLHLRIPHFLCRVCVCSSSDTARDVVVQSLRAAVLGISIVQVESLIATAFEQGKQLYEQSLAYDKYSETKEKSLKQQIALCVYDTLVRGQIVSDELSVCLIVHCLMELPNLGPGFVIADFPNTKRGAILLLEALSGINYDSHKPQPLDLQSPFAAPFVTATSLQRWNTSLCGLDMAIFVDVGDEAALINDRMTIRHRVDYANRPAIASNNDEDAHKSTVYLTAANLEAGILGTVPSVESLQELYTPSRPVNTCAIEFVEAAKHQVELISFLRDVVGIASVHECRENANNNNNNNSYGSGMDGSCPSAALSTASDDKLSRLGAIAAAISETFAAKVTNALKNGQDDLEGDIMEDEEGENEDGFDMAGAGTAAGEGGAAAIGGEEAVTAVTAENAEQLLGLDAASSQELDVDEEEALEAEATARRQQQRLELIAKCQAIGYAQTTPLPQQLAIALATLYHRVEEQSNGAIKRYYDSLRCVRYQQMQRRRAVNDIIQTFLACKDNRQSLLEEFRGSFNNDFDETFRFDIDCKAELLLRTVELGDRLWQLCEDRKKNVESVLSTISSDGIVRVLYHRVACEAAALLQSELARFVVSIDVIFDVSKSLLSFDYSTAIANALEETLPIPDSVMEGVSPRHAEGAAANANANAKGGKDGKGAAAGKDAKAAAPPAKGGKGGKDANAVAAPVPYRVPVSEVLMQPDAMLTIPEAKPDKVDEAAEAAAAAAAKKGGKAAAAPAGGKGKKGEKVEEVPSDPFEQVEKAVLEHLHSQWSKEGGFSINKILYSGDETVCASIEATIWHEVERLRLTASMIRSSVEHHKQWLERFETTLISYCQQAIDERFRTETSQVQCVLKLIGKCIEECEPMREEWLLAPDVVVVCKRRLVVPAPAPPIVPVVIDFYGSQLNQQQKDYLQQLLASAGPAVCATAVSSAAAIGSISPAPSPNKPNADNTAMNTTVIEQDMRQVLERLMTSIGPFAHQVNPANQLLALTFPKHWRKGDDFISSPDVVVKGSEEIAFGDAQGTTTGFINRDIILQQLLPQIKLPGLEEHVGVVESGVVFDYLSNLQS